MNALKRLVRPEQIREFSLVLLIVIGLLFFSTQIENYFNARLFNRIATSVAVVAVVAVGQTLVMLTRNIDLSVGSIVGFTAYFIGTQLAQNPDLTPLLVVLLAVGVGAGMGALNGLLVAYGRVPAIIVTLGTLALYRSILVEYGNAKTVTAAPRSSRWARWISAPWSGWRWPSWSFSNSSSATCASAGSCTPSAPTRRRRAWPACPRRAWS